MSSSAEPRSVRFAANHLLCTLDEHLMSAKGLVLVIDDDPSTQRLVERLLLDEGYDVEAADTIFVARQLLMQVTPDVILMDVELPDGNGLELTAWIKRNRRTELIPVIVLTSHTSLENRVAAREAGCSGVMSKPIEPGRFVKRVEEYLAARKWSSP